VPLFGTKEEISDTNTVSRYVFTKSFIQTCCGNANLT